MTIQETIYEAIRDAGDGGLTRYEISDDLGIQMGSVSRAVRNLILDGRVRDLSERRSRLGVNGAVLVAGNFPQNVESERTTDARMPSGDLNQWESVALNYLMQHALDGSTDREMADSLRAPVNMLSLARSRLVLRDLVADSGLRRGARNAIVWVALGAS